MSDDAQQQQSSQPESQAPAPDQQQQDSSGEVTPEAIEQFWRNRQSQSDKAHAAEAAALRERIQQLEQSSSTGPRTAGDQSEDSNALIEQLRSQLAEEKQLRVTETRAAKYPYAAEALDEVALSQMDEGKLANINQRLAPPSFGVDRNNPARSRDGGQKPISEMSTQELKEHLKTLPVPGQQPS